MQQRSSFIFNIVNYCYSKTQIYSLDLQEIKFKFKDLESRFNSIISTKIEKPDDQIIEVIINKFFSDHQVLVPNDVIKYLSGRIIRSYGGLSSLLENINDLSLKNKQKITIPFLRENFFK